jgi:hypothetical protein
VPGNGICAPSSGKRPKNSHPTTRIPASSCDHILPESP